MSLKQVPVFPIPSISNLYVQQLLRSPTQRPDAIQVCSASSEQFLTAWVVNAFSVWSSAAGSARDAVIKLTKPGWFGARADDLHGKPWLALLAAGGFGFAPDPALLHAARRVLWPERKCHGSLCLECLPLLINHIISLLCSTLHQFICLALFIWQMEKVKHRGPTFWTVVIHRAHLQKPK